MKYIVCEKPGEFVLKEKEPPIRKSGEALLSVTKVGICGTDLHAYAGNQPFFTYPRILGHELAATILEIDANDRSLSAGDQVIVMPYRHCGQCVACNAGKTNCCVDMRVLGVHEDGGMQEVIAISVDLLLPANDLSDSEVALVEPLAIGAHALQRAQLQKGEIVLVIGCGPIGLGIMKLAQIHGAKVIAMDVNERRLRYASETLGIEFSVNGLDDNPIDKIMELTSNELASVVIDATGNRKALETGIDYMSHGGRFVLVGLSKENLTFNHPVIHAKEASILCSRNAVVSDFEKVIEILRKGNFPVSSYITHEVSLEDMINHFDSWLKPESGVIKAMVAL